jgi:hypothetical protein
VATPTLISMNLPDALPMRGVTALVSAPLPDPVPLGPAVQTLDITIGGASATVTTNLPLSVPRSELAGLLQAIIRDADARFAGTRVALHVDRLIVLPARLVGPLSITSPAGATIADDLGLTAPQPAGASSAAISGELDPVPAVTAARAQLRIRIGASAPALLTFDRPTSLSDAAGKLETAIRGAAGTAAFVGTVVAVVGPQLLVIPGAAQAVVFEPAPGDDTAAELQLRARYAVRVRVNGAESVDEAVLELPQ